MIVSTTLKRAYLFFLITQWCLYHPEEGFHVAFIMQSPKFLMNVSTTLKRALPLLRVVETFICNFGTEPAWFIQSHTKLQQYL